MDQIPDNIQVIIDALRGKAPASAPPQHTVDQATLDKWKMMHDYFVNGKPPTDTWDSK